MKKHDYLLYAALALLSHVAQCAAFILLLVAIGPTAEFPFIAACGLALGAVFIAALSFGFGRGLRPKNPLAKNTCWNAAMVLYILNLALFLLAPEPMAGENIVAMLWNFPIAPALTGAEGVLGGQGSAYLFLGALLCAVEPLCFTLGMTCGAKPAATPDNDKETNPHA